MHTILFTKKGVIWSIVIILILTILEFPAPIGFETRPQDNVSLWWLLLFVVILLTEIITLFTIYKKPSWGARFGIIAGVLNVAQVIADQMHLMQPELAPFGYRILENMVALFSIALIYFSWKILRTHI